MEHPSVWGRLLAVARGEIPSDTLEAYRRAGGVVYDLLEEVEDRRRQVTVQGLDPWSVDPATQVQFLCTWNAFALQTLGDQFLEADYRSNPATTGYVPPVTAQQVLAFYREVEGWVGRAQRAQSDPASRLDVAVPVMLPPWVVVEPCPPAHLDGMRAAARSIREHAEAAMAAFQEERLPDQRHAAVQSLRGLLAEATTQAEYADRLWTQHASQDLHEQIERSMRAAIERYYRLGQLLAMPDLIDQPQQPPISAVSTRAVQARVPALPGQPGFDPWCLTDPETRPGWQRDPAARQAIANLWRYDPDPRRTLEIQAEIDAALAGGEIDYAVDRTGRRLGHYFCCPWASVYVVKRPIGIGGRSLRPLEEFTYDVSAEEVLEGGQFKREILVGVFQPTEDVDYCDPHGGGHRDE